MATRLDAAPWRSSHTPIALGLGWMLDAFEVQIIGSVIPGIQQEFGLDARHAVWINVVWFVGIALGTLDQPGHRWPRLVVAAANAVPPTNHCGSQFSSQRVTLRPCRWTNQSRARFVWGGAVDCGATSPARLRARLT